MISTNSIMQVCWICVTILVGAVSPACPQATDTGQVLQYSVDTDTGVRFFDQPADGDYFHYPLVFRAVDEHDTRINKAPMAPEGRMVYVSFAEMQDLLQDLARSRLSWQRSKQVEEFGPSRKLEITGTMVITVISTKGTFKASLEPKKICETFEPLDSALKTPRALWEFQGFRVNYGCKVRNFIYNAYQDQD